MYACNGDMGTLPAAHHGHEVRRHGTRPRRSVVGGTLRGIGTDGRARRLRRTQRDDLVLDVVTMVGGAARGHAVKRRPAPRVARDVVASALVSAPSLVLHLAQWRARSYSAAGGSLWRLARVATRMGTATRHPATVADSRDSNRFDSCGPHEKRPSAARRALFCCQNCSVVWAGTEGHRSDYHPPMP